MARTGHAWARWPWWAAKLAAPALTGIVIGTIFAGSVASAAPAAVTFASPVFVDQVRAGGKTWPHGTTNCHEGDRPWLAGGVAGEVFMSTDTEENGHTVFQSTNYADSCGLTGIADNGTFNGENYSGFGKLTYDPFDGSL